MPNETIYDEFCDPKNQIPQLPQTQALPHTCICPSTLAENVLFSCKFISICGRRNIFHISIYEA